MDIEFHYYITYILAQRARFSPKQSHAIACASQFVDDNDIDYTINEGMPDEYHNYISQTMNILRPKHKLMRIYPCFHFVPGKYDARLARRKDGKMHILTTTPNSRNGRTLMRRAFLTDNCYRIGIATHAYADTWAHQNFVGYYDYFNGMGGVLERLSPNIGHADAGHKPDIPGLVWKDVRLVSRNHEVNNKQRFLAAAKQIFVRFKKYKDSTATAEAILSLWEKLEADLDVAIGPEFIGKDKEKDQRIARYRKLIRQFEEYQAEKWFSDAVTAKVKGLPDKYHGSVLNKLHAFDDKYFKKKGFDKTPWSCFQQAVKAHQNEAGTLYAGMFKQMEVDEY